jgi:hypothetical protein
MKDLNELLYEIYDELKIHGLVESGNEFSREWLGRSDRLYSWIKSSGHEPNLAVMMGLYTRLDLKCWEAIRAKEHLHSALYEELADRLWEAIRAVSIRKGPNRRKKPVSDDAQAGA